MYPGLNRKILPVPSTIEHTLVRTVVVGVWLKVIAGLWADMRELLYLPVMFWRRFSSLGNSPVRRAMIVC